MITTFQRENCKPVVAPSERKLALLADESWTEPLGGVVRAVYLFGAGHVGRALALALAPRGIDAEQAQRLVVRGFFAEIVDRIPVPDLAERIMAAVDAELDAAEAGRVGAPSPAVPV